MKKYLEADPRYLDSYAKQRLFNLPSLETLEKFAKALRDAIAQNNARRN